MPDDELHVVAMAGDHHLLGAADRFGHRLLAQDGLGLARRRCCRPWRMTAMPGADGHDIELFAVQHLARIAVMLRLDLLGDIHRLHRALVEVGQCGNLESPAIDIASDVMMGHLAAADDTNSQFPAHPKFPLSKIALLDRAAIIP